MQNLLSKIVFFAKAAADYLVDLYTTEWLFKLLTYIAAVITILIPVVALARYIRARKSTATEIEKINLSGKWYAVWQTTVNGLQNINTELLLIKHRRNRIVMENLEKSPDNKLGGYLWHGECKLYDNEHILGYYLANEPNVISKGVFYFLLNRNGNFMTGKWVGCNIDYEFTYGYGVIAKDKNFAIEKLNKLIKSKIS